MVSIYGLQKLIHKSETMKKAILILGMFFYSLSVFAQFEVETPSPAVISEGIDSTKKKTTILVYPGFGVSLVRNDLAPVFYISVGFNHMERYEANINTSSFFLFERDIDKNFKVYRNTFLNAEMLVNFSPFNRTVRNWNGFGVGYLIESKGQYFRETTMMIYYKKRLKHFAIVPGILFADNFKELFPVISVKF
jgi:hypothetical protein